MSAMSSLSNLMALRPTLMLSNGFRRLRSSIFRPQWRNFSGSSSVSEDSVIAISAASMSLACCAKLSSFALSSDLPDFTGIE